MAIEDKEMATILEEKNDLKMNLEKVDVLEYDYQDDTEINNSNIEQIKPRKYIDSDVKGDNRTNHYDEALQLNFN